MRRLPLPALLLFSLSFAACVVVADDDGGGDTESTTSASASGPSSGSSNTGDPSGSGTTTDLPTGTSTTSEMTTGQTATSDDPMTSGEGSTGSDSGGSMGGGEIDVTLTGCSVDLGGTVVVSYNGSLGVASVYDNGGTLTGSFQFDLQGTGAIALSTQHRVDTGEVVNLVSTSQSTTWTNLDSDSLSGGTDRIGGTLTVNTWDPANGVSDLAFTGVTLLDVGSDNVCTINGTIVTTELYP